MLSFFLYLTKKIVYTSDLGNIHIDKYYSNTFEPITKCDLFIGETTYAGNEKIATNKVRKHDLEKLKSDIFFTCLENKSRLLIPVFAMDRCQNMLTHIYNLMANEKDFKNIPVYVDSPMAINMCKQYYEILEGEEAELWRKVLCWDNLHFVESSEESKNIRDSKQPCVVLSSSGMIVPRGRSAGWACSMLPRVNDKIAFCGLVIAKSANLLALVIHSFAFLACSFLITSSGVIVSTYFSSDIFSCSSTNSTPYSL